MKKILLSVSIIAAVAAIAFGVTTAFFSDTETSTGNTFTAGQIDLKVSSLYTDYTGVQGSFSAKDLNGDPLFSFADMKPGDMGGGHFDITADNNPYWACMKAKVDTKPENNVLEPETSAGDTVANGNQDGELQNYLSFYLWNDKDGDGQYTPGDLNKDRNLIGPLTLAQLEAAGYLPLADTTPASFFSPNPLNPATTYNLGYKYCFGTWGANPLVNGLTCSGAGDQNIAQTDGVTGTIDFYAVQARNNMQFTCGSLNPVRIFSSLLQYGPMGWGGWSCPAGTHAIGGGTIGATQPITAEGIAQTGATIGGSNYPVFPHYTFSAGETGYVVQNGNVGQNLTIYVDCLTN